MNFFWVWVGRDTNIQSVAASECHFKLFFMKLKSNLSVGIIFSEEDLWI